MLQKVGAVLLEDGGDFDEVLDRVKRRCVNCRGLS